MAFNVINLGRLSLTEMPFLGSQENPATESTTSGAAAGRVLHIAGQEGFPVSATVAQLAALHDDLEGLAAGGYLIPVRFGDKSDRNGYYLVAGAQNALENYGSGEGVKNGWSVDLQRVGTSLEVDLESRLTGPNTVNTTTGLTGVQWNSPPASHYAFFGFGTTANVTRACSDGPAQTVYTASFATPPTTARWGCAVVNYGNGRVRFLDNNSLERSGIGFGLTNAGAWTLSNGLVQVQPGSGGNVLDVACWSGGAWQNKLWDLTSVAAGGSLSGWQSADLLRNDYEAVTVRLVKDSSPGRTLIDLTLRRGSRFVEIYINSPSNPTTLKAVRHSAEAGTSGTGTVTATANDAAGNQYTVGSAHTATADTVNGGLSVTGSATFDCYIGAVVGGTGHGALDDAGSLMLQYLGRRGEYVQAVRR